MIEHWPQNLDVVKHFIAEFEVGTWPRRSWTHRAHLIMAAFYLLSMESVAAGEAIRSGIRRYNEMDKSGNTEDNGFHESITQFWILIISDFIRTRKLRKVDLYSGIVAVAE